MAALGLQPEQPLQVPQLGLWPENWAAFQVFRRMLTQLNVGGMGGVIGLRYEALPMVMRVCRVPRADLAEVMDCIQIMERHMVQLIADKKR